MTNKKKTIMSFATVLCLIPENVNGRLSKITGNGQAASCQLFYRKIYGCFPVYVETEDEQLNLKRSQWFGIM